MERHLCGNLISDYTLVKCRLFSANLRKSDVKTMQNIQAHFILHIYLYLRE